MPNPDRTQPAGTQSDAELDSLLSEHTAPAPAQDSELDGLLAGDADAQSSEVKPTMEDYEYLYGNASDVLTHGSPEFENLVVQINDALRAEGWAEEDIAKLNFPGGIEGMEIGTITEEQYKRFREISYPILADNRELLADEADLAEQFMEEHGEEALSQFDWSNLRLYMGRFHEVSRQALGQNRRNWGRFNRYMAEDATDALRDPYMELESGVLLLDAARWINTKFKLAFIGEHDHEDLQNRALKPVVFKDRNRPDEQPREFTNGFTATFEVLKRNAAHRASQMGGVIVRDFGVALRKIPGPMLEEVGKKLQGQGQAQVEDAMTRMRNLEGSIFEGVALAGKPVEWYQIMESYVPEEGVDAWYAAQYDAGLKGQLRLGAYALGSGGAELTLDPFIIAGGVTKQIFRLGRFSLAKYAPEQAAKIAEAVARRTYDGSDAALALKRAEDYLARTHADHLKNPTVESARAVDAAFQNRTRARQWMRRFEDATDAEAIAIRTPNRAPETITLRETVEILQPRVAGGVSTAEEAAKQLENAQRALAGAEMRMNAHAPTRVPPARERLTSEIEALTRREAEIKEVPLGLKDTGKPNIANERHRLEELRRTRGQRTKLEKQLAKLPEEEPNPAYVRAQDAYARATNAVKEAEAKAGMTVEHGAAVGEPVTVTRTKTAEQLAEEVHAARVKSAANDNLQPIDTWHDEFGDFDPRTRQRIMFGPDDTEQAGDGLAHMVQSGGTGVDDILTTSPIGNPRVEQTVSPGHGVQDAFLDWRALDRQNDITRLERQWNASGRGKQLNLLERQRTTLGRMKQNALELREKLSAQRLSIRQRSLSNANEGRARNSLDRELRDRAQHYRNEARRLARAEKRLDMEPQAAIDDMVKEAVENGATKEAADALRKELQSNPPLTDWFERTTTANRGKPGMKWLPVDNPGGVMGKGGRLNRWLEASGHRIHRSLYPGGVAMNYMEILGRIDEMTEGYQGKPSAQLPLAVGGAVAGGAAGFIGGGPVGAVGGGFLGAELGARGTRGLRKYANSLSLWREPHRFFGHHDPQAWAAIRANYENYHQQSIREFDRFTSLGEKAGLFKRRKGWLANKYHGPYEVDEEISAKLFDVADMARDTEEQVAKRLAAYEELTPEQQLLIDEWDKYAAHAANVQGIPADQRISGYISHVWSDKDFANGARPLELNGIPANADVWTPHLMERHGTAGYKRDFALAVDYYIRGKNRAIHLQPMYNDILESGRAIAQKTGDPRMYSYASDLVRELKGQPSFLGTRIDEMLGNGMPGRVDAWGIDRQLMGVSALWWAGTLPGNPRYPIMQVATNIATTSGRFGMYRTMRGLFQQATKEGRALAKAAGVERQIKQVFESDHFRKAANLVAELPLTISPLGVTSVTGVENYIRGATFHAAVDMKLTQYGFATIEEAAAKNMLQRIYFESLVASEQVNHVFGAMGRSPWGTRFTGKGPAVAITQFLSFIPKQLEELASQAWRDPGNIAEYMAVSGYISRIAATELGIDMTDYVGLGFMPTEPSDVESPAMKYLMTSGRWLGAWASYDSAEMDRYGAEMNSQLQSLLPMMSMAKAVSKAGDRLVNKELTSSQGRKERNLDFKDTGPLGTAEGFARSIDPDMNQGLPALGGDLIPSMTGMQSIQDRLYYQGKQRVTNHQKAMARDLRVRTQHAIDYLETGDVEKFQAAVTKLFDDYQIKASENALENEIVAREISWVIRNADENDPNILFMLKMAEQYGIKLQP